MAECNSVPARTELMPSEKTLERSRNAQARWGFEGRKDSASSNHSQQEDRGERLQDPVQMSNIMPNGFRWKKMNEEDEEIRC